MQEMKYPIGIQTFSEIINRGYTYVDKTAYIPALIGHGKYLFLSRPRRFGKSLLLSTLEAFFEGQRALFKGLALDSMDVEWISSPVIHIDFNNGLYEDAEGLLAKLHDILAGYEREYGLEIGIKERTEIPIRFQRLINGISDVTGRQVVILIDEYDKPLLTVETDLSLFEKHQALLKSFFGNLKSMDRYIRFAFVTGVARFNKVSIFSDLNNLDDISLEDRFADICGWTEQEFINSFRPGIANLAATREEDFNTTLVLLREYYDGYLFTRKGSRLYNPYSLLRALKAESIEPFWFSTGTPTFLVNRIKAIGLYPPDLNGQWCSHKELAEVGMNPLNPIPLMFQTGYLTIGRYDKDMELYELRFPNHEVEIGFFQDLLPTYVPDTENISSPFNFKNFIKDLFQGKPEEFMKRLSSLLKDLPGEDHCEAAYRAITYLLTVLCAPNSLAEHHGYLGRSDIEVLTKNYIYFFEFKYNKNVKEAMDQIYSRDYAGRYSMDSRTVFLIGANYNEKKEKRGLEYRIEKLTK